MNAGNQGTFDKDKLEVIRLISEKPMTVRDLSHQLSLTPGYASALIFHIDRHERVDLEVTGEQRDRRYCIL